MAEYIICHLYLITYYSGTLMIAMNATLITTPIMPIHTMLDRTEGTMIQGEVDTITLSTGEMDFTGYGGLLFLK